MAQSSADWLTSLTEIQRLFSTQGVDLRVDDQTDSTDAIDDCIIWATETIESYTLQHYNTVNLRTSGWARRRATILAAYYLSLRRGNPPQFAGEAKRVLEDLEAVRDDKIIIPDAIARAADVPAVSNYIVDDRYAGRKLRVIRDQSTKPYPGQPFYEPPTAGDF